MAALHDNDPSPLTENMVGVAYDASLAEVFLYAPSGEWNSAAEHADVIAFEPHCIDVKVHAYDLKTGEGPHPEYWPIPHEIRDAFVTAAADSRGGLGQVFVWTAGNGAGTGERTDYEELVSARYTIAVGAVDSDFSKTAGSELGSSRFCTAPGGDLLLTGRTPDGAPCPEEYIPSTTACSYSGRGTSYSAPHVGGVIALMLQAQPNLAWRDVMEAIVQTADTVNPGAGWQTNTAGFDHSYEYGHGFIDAAAAVNYVKPFQEHPNWEPLLGEREIIVPLSPNGVTVGPGQTRTLTIEVERSMRLEHVELLIDIEADQAPGIGPLEIEIDRLQVLDPDNGGDSGGVVSTRSIFAVAHTDPALHYWNPDPDPDAEHRARFTSVRHWGETAMATWKVRLRNTSTSNEPVTATWNVAELRFYGTPKDIADWDMDTFPAQPEDCILYRSMYDVGDPLADLNGDRDVTPADLESFERAYGGPCD